MHSRNQKTVEWLSYLLFLFILIFYDGFCNSNFTEICRIDLQNIIISISFQPDDVNLRLFDLTELLVLKYLRSSTLWCKDIGIRKPEFVAKAQFPKSFLQF